MKVTIQLTCDLEEVPEKMSELLDKAMKTLHEDISQDLKECQGLLRFSKDPADLATVFKKIESLKNSVLVLNDAVDDCAGILKGYVGVLTQIKAEEAKQRIDEISPTVDEIVSQIGPAAAAPTEEGDDHE